MTRRYQVRLHEMTKQGLGLVTGAAFVYHRCKPRQKPQFCFAPLTALPSPMSYSNNTIPRILLLVT
jgi:hypothetical protein